MQLHVRSSGGPVVIRGAGVRRRYQAAIGAAEVSISEPALQRLVDAQVNTMRNAMIESVVDGMGRERQQYSGDCGHQLSVWRLATGDASLPGRFLNTWSMGLTLDGYFLDCWPCNDRLVRLAQRQVGTTPWGPLLDHGVGFAFDAWRHYLWTGDAGAVRPAFERLAVFFRYLRGLLKTDGLLPVEDIGVPTVWIDHDAFAAQRDKRLAFNLYVAASAGVAMAGLAVALGQPAGRYTQLAEGLTRAAVAAYWCPRRRVYINNLPTESTDGGARMDDRSLATAVLYGLCPDGDMAAAVARLADLAGVGLSYPANAQWRLEALAYGGRADVVVRELRERWATMPSVIVNNAIAEFWSGPTDSSAQWSHCAAGPLWAIYEGLLGLRPTTPGFATFAIRPQLEEMPAMRVTARTPRGPIEFAWDGQYLEVTPPAGVEGTVAGRSIPGGMTTVLA